MGAITGGKGWSDVKFENHQTKLTGDVAIAMGNYYFTCAQTGAETKVEYTFGYKKCEDGHLRIFLHHSSVPFSEASPAACNADSGVVITERSSTPGVDDNSLHQFIEQHGRALRGQASAVTVQ